MRRIVLVALMLYSGLIHCQVATDGILERVKFATELLRGDGVILQDIPRAISLLDSCASQGNIHAAFFLGKIYIGDKFIPKDEDLAFKYIQQAADSEHAGAAAYLGRCYKYGIGCAIDLEEALKWYETSYNRGSSRGAFLVGYMYMKGLGTIEQSYTEAIKWFEKSDFPKAKLWLAVCHYFGFGTPINKTLAIDMLASRSDRKDFKVLLEHLESGNSTMNTLLSEVSEKTLSEETEKVNQILNPEDGEILGEQTTQGLTAQSLYGKWEGHLIELDWSGERMLRKLPAELVFDETTENGLINCSSLLNITKSSDIGIILDKSIYFTRINTELPRIYRNHDTIPSLDYKVLSADIELKQVDDKRYLIANLDTYIQQWPEPGPPMFLILSKVNSFTNDGNEISDELLQGLLSLKEDNFITVYPNPIQTDFLIQFNLDGDSHTTVELYSLDQTYKKTLANNQILEQGKQLYQFEGSTLHKGLYVVKVKVNNKVHTKLIIKE